METPEPTLQNTIDKNVEALWIEFQDIPVDRNGNLRVAWKAYPKGTNKNEVYGWFSRHYSKGLAYLMGEVRKEWKEQISTYDVGTKTNVILETVSAIITGTIRKEKRIWKTSILTYGWGKCYIGEYEL